MRAAAAAEGRDRADGIASGVEALPLQRIGIAVLLFPHQNMAAIGQDGQRGLPGVGGAAVERFNKFGAADKVGGGHADGIVERDAVERHGITLLVVGT
ncbi:MAG: hypothetical protein H7Y60_03765 [Rhodospirillaceae bacterium]|nr:hypothetical protein [Rhodospirillales bacterium]